MYTANRVQCFCMKVSIHGMTIYDCLTSLFLCSFVGLVMTQAQLKHVAILCKQ
jgi:hypothetical protein